MPRRFVFLGNHVLLTYPQCGDLDPAEVVRHIEATGGECIIGREPHADGGLHLHCFVQWEHEFYTTDARRLDVDGCHPNFRKMYRTPEKGYDYAIKSGDVVGGSLERPSGTVAVKAKSPWPEIILAETRDEFFDLCARLDPRSLCTGFMGLSKYADWKYRVERGPYSTPGGVSIVADSVPALGDWVRENLGGDRTITDVDYAVFDDMQGGLEFFHGYKFWLGCQSQFYATDKYKGKQLIDWGRPSIWLSNEDPRFDKNADVDWLNGNCVFIRLMAPIFRASTE
uniref:Replication-associated protein n=1 Tax=Turdus pallidus Genomoviridae sp. TaxID=2814956 RepID=A0A8E7G2C7_9VIRU